MRRTPEYKAWCDMKSRCGRPSDNRFHHYGARGIAVCGVWRGSFALFVEHVGVRPSPEHSLDRIDNDGDYEPGNARWATRSEQRRNRRDFVLIEFLGERLCISEWAARTGIGRLTLRGRLEAGWSVERALTVPVRGK